MKIVVAGATGLIGTHVMQFLGQMGHEAIRLVRPHSPAEQHDLVWDPERDSVRSSDLEGADAVVCLSGANIAEGRWTPECKKELRDSRVGTVSLLSRTMAKMKSPPPIFVCASATGIYGADRGEEILTDVSEPGGDFLGKLCTDWEDAAEPARASGVRVVHLRFGVVLTPAGGALKKMLPPFRLGIGGRLGSGRQYMSWLTIDEAVGIIDYAIQTDSLEGPVNAVSPNPVTNREFAKALARVLRRPALFPVPAMAIRALFGEMGEALLLGSIRSFPRRLETTGYQFRFPDLEQSLRYLLK